MKKAFHFLGGIRFAILLISLVALFVIAGTFIESITDSHLHAAHFTYTSSLFKLLLWFFFVNILFAALRRYPFKYKHVPFLTCHLGLLMILAGALLKSYSGTQGVMILLEGGQSNQIVLPNTEGLYIEKKGKFQTIPLGSSFNNLKIDVLDKHPHSKESISRWQSGITSTHPLKIITDNNTPLPHPVDINGENLQFFDEDMEPSLYITCADNGDETLYLFNQHGACYWQCFPKDSLHSLVALDDAYKGYAALFSPPADFMNLSKKSPDLSEFILSWKETGCWLYPKNRPLPESLRVSLADYDFNSLPKEHQNGLLWVSSFFDTFQGKTFEELAIEVKNHPLPFLKDVPLNHLPKELFALGQNHSSPYPVPLYLSPEEKANLFSCYLRVIDYPLDPVECLGKVKSQVVKRPPLSKWEDNRPMVTLKVSNGQTQEVITLCYDPSCSGFKWPILNGSYLLRYQPLTNEIPHKVRLRKARQINYPLSGQPFSYESDIIVSGVEKTISMNNVHETLDGYRFYMSNLSAPGPLRAKRVQLAVNHDPGKYTLTYPGAAFLALGILLLFWIRPYKK